MSATHGNNSRVYNNSSMDVMTAPMTSLMNLALCSHSKIQSVEFEGPPPGRSHSVSPVRTPLSRASSTASDSSRSPRRRFIVEDVDKGEEALRRAKQSSFPFPATQRRSSFIEPQRQGKLSSALLEEAQEIRSPVEPDLVKILEALKSVPTGVPESASCNKNALPDSGSFSSPGNQSPVSPRSPRRKFIVHDVDNDEQTAPIQLSAAPTTLDVAARRKALLTGCRSASLPSAAKLSSPLEDKNCPASCAEGSKSEAHMADNNPQNKSVQWAKETDPFTLQNKDLKTAIKLLQGRVQQLVIGLTSVC